MILSLANGDPERIEAQARNLHFVLDEKRFLPTSPIIAGSTADYGPLWGEALGRSDIDRLREEIDAISAVESLKALSPIDDPVAVCAELVAMGLGVGVATNDSEASARRQIETLGIDGRVSFIVGYDSGHGGKPDPGMVLAFARFLDVDPSAVAMVGDSLHDLDAARAAGALAVAVLTGPAERAELEPHADLVIEHIGELPRLLASLANG
jgi:phosphoglycolate phosphatase